MLITLLVPSSCACGTACCCLRVEILCVLFTSSRGGEGAGVSNCNCGTLGLGYQTSHDTVYVCIDELNRHATLCVFVCIKMTVNAYMYKRVAVTSLRRAVWKAVYI